MHTVENPRGVAQIIAKIPWGVNAFWPKSKRGTSFWILLHSYYHFFEKFAWAWSYVIPFPPYIYDLTWSVTRPPIPIVARPTAIRRSWNQDSRSVKSSGNLKTLLPEKIGRGLLINGALGIIESLNVEWPI